MPARASDQRELVECARLSCVLQPKRRTKGRSEPAGHTAPEAHERAEHRWASRASRRRDDGASHRRASCLSYQSSGKRTRWRQHASERSEDCTQKGAWSVYEFSNIDQTIMKEPSKFQLAWINEGSKVGLRLVEDSATVGQRFQYQMAKLALRLFEVLPNFFVQGL